MTDRIIVSRHRAAIEFIARELGGTYDASQPYASYAALHYRGQETVQQVRLVVSQRDTETIPVLASATADDVHGKIVYGTLPLHLAALAAEVYAIKFQLPCDACNGQGGDAACYCGGTGLADGPAPRGAEYTLAEMDAAGARLVRYLVTASDPVCV